MEISDLAKDFIGGPVFTVIVFLGLIALAVCLKVFLIAPTAEYKHDKNQ